MSELFECRYTIIEPGPIRTRDLVTLDWIDVTMRADVDQGPKYEDLKRTLRSIFTDTDTERVAVNSYNGPADMFVGDRSAQPDIPVNDLATAVYWTASIMHRLAHDQPSKYEIAPYRDPPQQLQIDALAQAVADLETDHGTPRVHGRAVLFDRKVWF